jgi:heterodisulfide reductase subunit A-like polyferredoxin
MTNTRDTHTNSAQAAAVAHGKPPCGAVLVVGAGIAGIQASLDLSQAGFRVYLVEQGAAVGGRMSRLDKTFPTGDCATCILSPKLVECMRDINIDVYTLSELVKLEGEAGNFTATLRQKPRFVEIDKCTGCGDCTAVCPVELPSTFDEGMGSRKAIDKLYAQAAPNANFITKKHRAPCSAGCPIDHSVQAYVTLIAKGKVKEAAAIIRRENPLPSVCGRVCFHPCEANCNRGKIDSPIAIKNLKRFAIESSPEAGTQSAVHKSGKSVAIIGSGPAGLSAAHFLALSGHDVTVFEALPVLGGMLAVGIPRYRLPEEILMADIDAIRARGVELKTNAAINDKAAADRIRKEFDAIFIGAGAHQSIRLGIPGEDSANVIAGIDFLRAWSLGKKLPSYERAVIIGGGNTAIDAARTAKRLGAKSVTIMYRRTASEMPASKDEVEATLAEGIAIEYLVAPVSVVAKNGKVEALSCIRMKLGKPDSGGRRRPVPIEESEFTVECDLLVPAVSQSSDAILSSLFGIELTKNGTIKTEGSTLATNVESIYAGGDVVIGPSSVVEAIAQGKKAAFSIDNYLSGRGNEDEIANERASVNPLSLTDLNRIKNTESIQDRIEADQSDISIRISDFSEVEKTYTADKAAIEAARCLGCADCCDCKLCVEACKAGAVNHADKEKLISLDVGAVLLTPGFSAFDATQKLEYGIAFSKNIVTNTQFERLLSASGPTKGAIVRPSDATHPKRLAFIQCVGSRDSRCNNEYCSSVCCMVATKEAILAKEHERDLDVVVFYMDLRAFGKDFDRYYERAKRMGVRYVRCRPSSVEENKATNNLSIAYVNEDGKYINEEFDLVVLSIGMEPSESLAAQAGALGVSLNSFGFAKTDELAPLETSVPGIFVGGAFQEPKDIPDTVMQSSGAAAKAMTLLAKARGSLIRSKTYPKERDIVDEEPRIGVFICHCGSNIASVVDVPAVVEHARALPGVVFAENEVYVCADDSQDIIKEKISEHRLNRVVIASCTPRTHEPIFRDTLRSAGLNQYLLEMANIRDQCSWVHSGDPEAATAKAKDLVRMMVGRAAHLAPLKEETLSVKKAALVIGGGIAGMTSALALADQGFPVHLVEKEAKLGGTLADMYRTLDGSDIRAFLESETERVNKNHNIKVHTQTRVSKVDGHIGKFKSTLVTGEHKTEVEHGIVILATGATERKPATYGYGASDRVVTQLELAGMLRDGRMNLPEAGTVVMIQCVEQRDDERPYCSRLCCATAVNHALIIKKNNPAARVIVLYRDMRTYGFKETAYEEARAQGVVFIRYDAESPPVVATDGKINVRVNEPLSHESVSIDADLLVLAAPVVPRATKNELSELLRVPLNADGFFLEAHVKLRPVDFASEGLFLCGTAHAPKFISETISQANAVAARAAGILSKRDLPVSSQTAWVDQDKCISCATCVHLCPYNAPAINIDNKAEIQAGVCMGCGSCTAECPAKAITLRNYADSQVLDAIRCLFESEPIETKNEAIYPELAGITPPRWHKEQRR